MGGRGSARKRSWGAGIAVALLVRGLRVVAGGRLPIGARGSPAAPRPPGGKKGWCRHLRSQRHARGPQPWASCCSRCLARNGIPWLGMACHMAEGKPGRSATGVCLGLPPPTKGPALHPTGSKISTSANWWPAVPPRLARHSRYWLPLRGGWEAGRPPGRWLP